MPRSIQVTSKVEVPHSPMQAEYQNQGRHSLCMCQPQPAHTWLVCIRNWVPSALRSQPQLQSFNSKKHLCTHESHLTKTPLWTAVKIPQQQGNPDTGELVLSHSCESRIHDGLGPNTHMQSVLSAQYINTSSEIKKIKYRRKSAHYFDDKCMFHRSPGKGTHFLFWDRNC